MHKGDISNQMRRLNLTWIVLPKKYIYKTFDDAFIIFFRENKNEIQKHFEASGLLKGNRVQVSLV